MTGFCHLLLQLNLMCLQAGSCISVGLRELLYQISDVLSQLRLVRGQESATQPYMNQWVSQYFKESLYVQGMSSSRSYI